MSERPENPNNEQAPSQGGWHSPNETSPWQVPETQTVASVAWREVKALPDDVDPEPEKRGAWHLPDEDDTIFSPEDVVEITDIPRQAPTSSNIPAVRPEDLIAEILGGTQSSGASVPNPEDFDYSSGGDDDDTAAADFFEESDTLLVDEADISVSGDPAPDFDLDDEDFSMGEYLALANLAQGDDDDMAGLNASDMSPSERAAYSAALNVADEMDSKRILEPDVPEDATVTMEDTNEQAVSQAEDYARKALEELGQSDDSQGISSDNQYGGQSQQQVPQQARYTPEEIQIANQFRETKRQVAILRQMQNQGQIEYNDLQARLQEHQIYDAQGNWWMVGFETDEWYRYNNQNGQWEAASPPVPLDAGQAMTETGLGQTAADVLPDSLPYLPNDGSQGTVEFSDQQTQYDNTQYSRSQQQYSEQFGTDDSPIRYPNQPQVDPNMTQVGNAADLTQLGYAEPTIQNLNMVDQTIPSNSYDGQATVPSASIGDLASGGQDQSIPAADQQAYDAGYTDYDAQGQVAVAPTYDQIGDERDKNLGMMLLFAGVGIATLLLIVVGGFIFFAQFTYANIIEEYSTQIAALGTQNFDFQTATILAADGTIIAELTGEQGARSVVSIENGDVSPYFVHAIVASEDPRFYENSGVDPLAIARAFFQNYFAGEVQSGASTITQQIVRDRILGSNVVTLDRKFLEALIAIEVASNYSKNQILDIYINEFFYGEQSYGVEAASEFYFDTSAADLDAAQAATLAGILPSPSDSNPVVAPALAFSNMRVILNRMIDVNCLNFQHGEWAVQGVPFCVNEDVLVDGSPLYRLNPDGTFGGFLAVQIARVETRNYEPRQSDIQYPHFVFYVLGELDAAYGRGAYIERGFTVQTSLVPRIQNTAEAALQQGVDQLALNGAQTGAALVLDPTTGAILAMVGSPDFNNDEIDGQNNNTLSLQQPGSAIKPIVYATALTGTPENGYFTPSSILWDVPSSYNVGGGTPYTPTNFDGLYRGPVAVRFALAQSLNIPAVKTYATFAADPTPFINTANAMGINFDPDPNDELTPTFGLPTAIGATEVSLMDLTEAYSVIANDGMRTGIFAIQSIEERNNSGDMVPVELALSLVPEPPVQAISPQVAYLLQNILSDDAARTAVVNGVRSTFPANSSISGASLGLNNINQVGAKTGTNNTANGSPSRIWTVGFTNNYAVGVWMGTLNQGTAMTGRVTGLTGASPVWNAIMVEALNNINPGSFDTPSGVVQDAVCQLTGTLSPQQTGDCPSRVTEIYIQSQPPPAQDAGFVATININSWTGLRSNQWCAENVVAGTYANISDPFATNWLTGTTQGRQILASLSLPTDLQAAPEGECQQGQPLPTVLLNFPQENTQLQGQVAFTGQVSAPDLQRWEVQISEVGTDNFRSIMPQANTNQVPTGGTVLYEWDSRTVANGAYFVRLAAFSTSGGFILRDVRVTVQNPDPTPIPATQAPIEVEISPLPFLPTPTSITSP